MHKLCFYYCYRKRNIIIGLFVSIVIISVIVAIVLVTNKSDDDSNNLPSKGEASSYANAGVASDHTLCSKIGKDILVKG